MNRPQPTPPGRRLGVGSVGLLARCRSSSLQYFTDAPTLVATERPALNDAHPIAYVTLIGFIVGFHSGSALQVLFILWMHDRAFNRYHNGLFHPIANHGAAALFSQASGIHIMPLHLGALFPSRSSPL